MPEPYEKTLAHVLARATGITVEQARQIIERLGIESRASLLFEARRLAQSARKSKKHRERSQ